MREWWWALIAEKKTKRSTPARSAARTQAQRGHRVQLLDRAARLVADRGGQVHDGVHAAQRVAERRRVGQVAQRDLDPHALVAEAARVAHQARTGRPSAVSRRSSAEPTVPVAPVRRITGAEVMP